MGKLTENALTILEKDPFLAALIGLHPFDKERDYCDIFLESHSYKKLPEEWRQLVEKQEGRSKAIASTVAYCRYKATELAHKHFPEMPEIKGVYWSENHSYCCLDKGYGEEEGRRIANKFDLTFKPASEAWDTCAWKRLDAETVIALCGDNQDEYYCLCLRWCPEEFAREVYGKDYPWSIR